MEFLSDPSPALDDRAGLAGVSSGTAARKDAGRVARAALARASSPRRRHIDPTTCERDYSPAELEFMRAIQDYKQSSGRAFPTWSEVLEVIQGLGYHKSA